jgi:hypothetical protein
MLSYLIKKKNIKEQKLLKKYIRPDYNKGQHNKIICLVKEVNKT